MTARWSYGEWRAAVRLPFGASWLVTPDATVNAGDVVARGSHYRATRHVSAARVLGCDPEEVRGLLRVRVGDEVRPGTIVARRGRRFARAIVAAESGRLVHLDADGDLYLGTVRADWTVRSPLDGVVRRADLDAVVIEGASWALGGLAAYGPSRSGPLALGVAVAEDELPPPRLDVSYAGKIVLGGARVSGEALTRAHAVGAHGVVAAAVTFRALLPVYGDDVSAFGSPSDEDVPTLLVLRAFGRAAFEPALFAALSSLEGARASIDTANGRLHVFAGEAASSPLDLATPALEEDLAAARTT